MTGAQLLRELRSKLAEQPGGERLARELRRLGA
jgi:hypothetical protein